jgi:hypothetical protein
LNYSRYENIEFKAREFDRLEDFDRLHVAEACVGVQHLEYFGFDDCGLNELQHAGSMLHQDRLNRGVVVLHSLSDYINEFFAHADELFKHKFFLD